MTSEFSKNSEVCILISIIANGKVRIINLTVTLPPRGAFRGGDCHMLGFQIILSGHFPFTADCRGPARQLPFPGPGRWLGMKVIDPR